MLEGMNVRTAAAALAIATPVATWWLVGDLSSAGFTEDELDYMFRAPDVPWFVEAVAGAVALAVVVVSVGVVGQALHSGSLRREWLPTIVLPAVAGVVLGFGARAVTAGGIGANIGGAMFIFIGLPLAVLLLMAAAINAWVEWRRS